jgi:hypothetical protein
MPIPRPISENEECSGRLSSAENIEFWQQLGLNLVGVISTKLDPVGWDGKSLEEAGIGVAPHHAPGPSRVLRSWLATMLIGLL